MKRILLLLITALLITCCSKEGSEDRNTPVAKQLTIFFINDQHGQIDNFAKVKHIIESERQKTNVVVACSGDIFSGNPIVDNHLEKGYPMVDLMNRAGFDITAIGNHEFDYGLEALKARMAQAEFGWVCANVDMGDTGVPQPPPFLTVTSGDIRATFLGLVETNGKENDVIPSTHPWKLEGITFEKPEDVIAQYAGIKEQENADLFIALSHLGYNYDYGPLGDFQLAGQFPCFDLIIGGHSHQTINTVVNGIPVFQAGSYLNYLGKIEISVKEREVESIDYDLINLNSYSEIDEGIKTIIDEYNDSPELNEVIGYSHRNHGRSQVGCFYTDALRAKLDVDVVFQNTGGIRAGLDQGDITKREIYEISPFNNGLVVFEMAVSDIKTFLFSSGAGFYYSGISLEKENDYYILVKSPEGNLIPDNEILTVGVNDYIAAVHDVYFPDSGAVQPMADAEAIISYLEEINSEVDYEYCENYFRY